MATAPSTCADCGTSLGQRNTSGYCGRHVGAANMRRPGARAYQVHRLRLRYAGDPELCAANADRLATAREMRDPEDLRARWLAGRPWVKGNAAQPKGSAARRRMAASLSNTRLAWCPPHMRDRYRALTKKGVRAAEARELILQEHEIEMRRWRRSVGIEQPVDLTPSRGLLFIDRASTVAAEWAGVANLWTGSKSVRLSRARWAVWLVLLRRSWSVNRIASETGMDRKSVKYGLAKAEGLVLVPGEFADLFARVQAA